MSVIRKAKHLASTLAHFKNPLLVPMARAGVMNPQYVSMDVRNKGNQYEMLGRPLGGDHRILREVLVDESYRPVLQYLPDEPISVVDVGAHIGAFTAWLCNQRKVLDVICFEPEAESFRLCRFNVGEKARVVREAVGGFTREAALSVDKSAHAKDRLGENGETVTVGSLANLPAADLLKLDCEGSEWEMLDRCPEALRKFKVIVAEIHKDRDKGRTPQDFARAMETLGFTNKVLSHRKGASDSFYVGTQIEGRQSDS